MEILIKSLQKSPLFNLSLSSKELFHSNFFYWIGQNYPLEFGQLFADYLEEKPADLRVRPEEIYREKDNIDLSFTYSNGEEILIENKVKSVPYLEQLQKYSKPESAKKNYILLSLSEPSFFQSKDKLMINGVTWHFMSYADLREKLRSIPFNYSNSYHEEMIKDYCGFIGDIIQVNELCKLDTEDLFDFHAIEKNDVYKQLHGIRLHDFYLKKKYELLAFEVFKKLEDLGKKVAAFGSPLNWNAEPQTIFIGYGMTRGQGFMDLKYFVAPQLSLGIQIQGDHYRMVVEDSNGIVAKNLKEKLNDGLWFDFSRSFPDQIIFPKGEKEFNNYEETSFYKSIKVGLNLRIAQILECITADVNHIKSNFKKIQAVLNEELID